MMDFNLKNVLFYISFLLISQSFLTSSIIYIRWYKNRFSKKVGNLGKINPDHVLIYSLYVLFPLFYIYASFLFHKLFGFISIVFFAITSCILLTIPISSIKEVKREVRLPKIRFKKNALNLFMPEITFFSGILILIVSEIL